LRSAGAKLLWGCEAVAVAHEGGHNPNFITVENKANFQDFAGLFSNSFQGHIKKIRDTTE